MKCAEYNQLTGVINVYHQGCHTCLLKSHNESAIEMMIEEYIRLHPDLPAKELHDVAIVDLLKKGKVKEAFFLALHLSPQCVNNMKRRQDYYEPKPINSLEAVGELKKATDSFDPLCIYKINSQSLNGQMSFVFKSSRISATIALQMDIDSTTSNPLQQEVVFFYAMHSHVKGYKTLTLWVHNPILVKLQ